MNKKKLFLIHNHKNFSGAARSLGELVIALKKKIDFTIICPKGTSSEYFKSLNIDIEIEEVKFVPRFNHFEIGYYKGLRWLMLIREMIAMIYFYFYLIFLKKKYKKIERVHLNEFELIIIAPIFKLLFKSKISSHLRCPLEIKKGKQRYNLLKKICENYITKIIAIDDDCYSTSPIKRITTIIHNGINKKNLILKKNRNIKKKIITFGFIGNFIERKGIYEILKVFKKKEIRDKAKLICMGKNKTNNKLLNFFGYEKNFQKFCEINGIFKLKNINIIPMQFNLKNFYSKIDVIIFPSYMNAVGRPVIEAALLKKPSIIALNKYNRDTAQKGNCVIFKPGNLKILKEKILLLINNKSKLKKMGEFAYVNAKKNFDINKNCKTFYKNIC